MRDDWAARGGGICLHSLSWFLLREVCVWEQVLNPLGRKRQYERLKLEEKEGKIEKKNCL